MVLMLWFYNSGLVILVGAELNAEIEHMSPYGKGQGREGSRREVDTRPVGHAGMAPAAPETGTGPPSADEVEAAVGSTPTDVRLGAPLSEQEERARRSRKTHPAPLAR
jgi:membrane protein